MASAGARAYNGGLGAEPPAGSRGRARGQGVRRSPPKAENLLASRYATEAANLPHSPQFANFLLQFNNSYKRDTVKQSSGGGSNLRVRGHMASAEREPIRGSGGGAPSGVQGQSPWSEGQGGRIPMKLKGF